MPVFNVRSPDGQLFRVTAPEGATEEEIIDFAQSQMGQFNAPKPQEGIGAALTGGFKRFLSSGETALESLINPELAAQRGAERSERIGAQYAPGASLEKVKQVYEQQGLFPAAKEVISQIPSALAEQAPNIAATLASARTGAMVGAPFGGPIGALAGGVAGAALPSLVQLYGANLERQFEEKTPEISRASAFGAAVPGAALEVASQFIPLGRGWLGKLLGPTAEKALARGSDAAVERAAKESLASSLATGTITGSLAEIPTEVAQQMLERYQAGLSLTDEEAQKEYGEAAYGAALVGGPFGAAARGLGRPGARAEFEKRQQEEQARLAVTEEELAQRFPEGTLPGGFRIDREEVGREIGPAGFSIMAEGREEPIAVVDTQEEADAKLESLTKIRQEEAEKLLAEEQKINAEVEKTKARLEQLEATEQTDTEEYKSLKAGLPAMMEDSAQRVSELYNKVESLSKPLTAAPFGETERVNEQFNVFDQAGKAVGTYKTLGEAEASIKDVVGSEEFDRKIQAQETAKQLYKAFVPQMRKFGLGDVGLNIVDQIENGAGGAYLKKLIKVSLEDEAPVQTMRHESLHALKDLGFFTPQQWKALEERAKKEWIEDLKKVQYSEGKTRHDAYIDLFTQEGKDKGFDGKELDQYVNDSLIEEAIADAFGAYDKGVKPPPGLIAALYRKLKNFFANLGQALRGAGFQSADDIFQQIERGELKAAKAQPVAEEKLSLRVAKKVAKQLGIDQQEIDSTSIGLQTGKAGVDQFKKNPIGGLPQVVQFLEDRRAKSGLRNLDISKEEDREELAKLMSAEAMAAINAGGNALQWYDSVIDSMMNMAALKYQELATNEDNKAALRMAIAIASQGLNVEDNLTFAMSQYDYFRKEGKFKEIGSGTDGAAMKSNFILANQMIEQYKLPNFRKFLQTEFTVEELRGAGFDIGGELGDEKVTGSAIFGPKIGFGFYSNLSGNFEPVTMDMWFMRTVGRLSGKLKGFDQKKFDEQIKRFRQAMSETGDNGVYADEFKDEEIKKAMESAEGAVNLSRIVNSVFNSDFINNRALYDEGARKKTNLVYAAQNIIKSFDASKDAPQNGTERRLLRDVVARTVDKVAKAYGQRIPPASLQALIWYPEQELYKALGVKLRVTSQDYAGAIKKILKKEGYNESTIDRAAKSGPRAVQPVAGEQVQAGAGAAGQKPQTSFEPSEREAFLEERREEQVLKQEREAPRRKKVIFEVAPDPNNKELTERWRALSQSERLRISNEIAKKIIDAAKAEIDFDGRVVPQVGSYLDDTNPSFALFLEKGNAVEVSKFLGYALSQDSMMVVSPRPAPGLDKVGAVVIDVGTQTPSEVDAVYQQLREISLNGEQPVGGQTTMNNKMIVLNYSNVGTEELADLIDKKLKGQYDVQYTDVYSAFPEKKDYDYADPQNDPRGKEKAVRERSRSLRSEATRLLEEELGAKPEAPAGQEKLSLRKTNTPEFKQWFGRSKIVNKDGTPMVMYHGLAKDTTDFTRKTARGAPIFLTDDPDFAAKFAADSYLQVAAHPEKYLTKEQLGEGEKKAIAAIRKDYKKDTLGQEMIASIRDGSPTAEAREYLQKEYVNMLPAGPHIMPLYVRAENPFDYENPSHVRKVLAELSEGAYDPADIRAGNWESIENEDFQDAIQYAGFDSFYVKEQGRKNLAVYQPNQVKSATGNIGTFDLKNPDVRYSLRGVAFPTVKEAREAAEQQPVPDTAEFKQYIAGSQWLDEDGKAKKFFHATTGDFFEFRDGAVYLSETAEESEKWGRLAEDRLREKIYKALNKSEKLPVFQQAVDQAVEAGKITEAEGVEFMRDVKRSVPDFGKYDAIKSEMDDALLALSPSRMKIMPLYARAMNPFDFRNKEHVEQVVDYITRRQEFDRSVGEVAKEINEKIGGAPTTNTENILKGLKGLLVQGYEKTIVDPMVQHAIRRLNFDGYLVRRNRQSPISYAIYQPKQLKSITGNDGQFSLETNDIRYSLRRAAYTPQRIDRLIDQFAYTQNDAENDTKAYIARVNPRDFLRATTTYDGLDRIRSEAEPLDVERLMKEGQPIYLSVREGKFAGADVWEIRGHEGRHRMMALADAGYDSVPVVFDFGQRVRNAQPTGNKYIVRQNFGGDIGKAIQDFSIDNAIPVSYGQKDDLRQFEKTDGIKFSLPSISAADRARMNRVAPQRYTPGWKERVVGAFKQDFTQLRQQFLNRYESLAVYDRMLREMIRKSGGPELLADQSAEFAALQSDLSAGVAASAMGIGDRQGGVPVYRNGVTTIDTSVKGLTEALAPLAKYGDPEIYQRYQFWAGWKRGRRLLAEGKERLYEPADAAIAARYEKMHPEFIQVQKDLIAFNDGIVNFAVQTGVLSKERARVYTQYADYIPFYRQFELDKTIGPNPFSGISGVKGPKAIKGGESPLGDFMENMVRNTQSLINAGMKNVAAQRATDVAMRLNMGLVQRLPGPVTGVGVDAYTVLENGQLVYYRSADPLFIQSLASLNMPDLPFMGLLSTPANALRNLVTKDPGFMFANLLRDSLSAYVTSGQNITPIVGTMVNFGKALSGKDKNLQALFNAGVIGGYEFSQNIQQSGKSLTADLNKKAGTDATLLRPFKSLWEGLEKGTTASDAATRMAVYERVMKETNGNEAEAISRALEVMNFNRKGSNVLIRVATAALPFFNARLQGLDLFYRASTGRMDTADAQEIKRKFWVRGLTMAGLSAMYYMSVAGDDEYEKQEEETKDNNWIFPSLGIRIPIPFEVGTLFKTVPERITAYIMGNDTGKDLKESSIRALANTFAFNPIPQTFKPLIEVATNYNFFTMRSIVGQGMQDVAPQFQVGPGTSKTAEWIGGKLGLSPMKIDQLIKGYTGTIGGYVIDVVDAMANEFADVPKASKRFEQMPIIKRFMLDPEARGSVTQFYELQKSVDTFVRTANLLEKTARPEEYAKYVQENIGMLAAKDYVQETEKVMKDLREMKRTVNSLDMPPDEKRDLLLDLGRAETHLTSNIKTIKKAVSELK